MTSVSFMERLLKFLVAVYQIVLTFQNSITNTSTITNAVTNTDIFKTVIIKLYKFFRYHIHHYWYFLRVIIQRYIFFTVHINHYWQTKQSPYQKIITFSESYYQITLSFSEFTSNNKRFQIELLLTLQTIFR